jgi:eukaryotic-like serine/threonine-protein kinase
LKKLGKYEVLGELGHGAMGVVYRARDPIINRLVALKTITTGVADDPALLQRFYREAQSAGGLQHPNIVTIYDMGEAGNLPFIAMELVEGENLEQVIARRAPLPITLKLLYAMQACRAFDYAHKRGIVHRDIKPGNIMLSKDGTVKVVDFGIARVLEASRTQTGMLIGTFAYMSPEQYHGEHADERSDIWSFGVLLYELLSYERPFTGPTPASLMRGICEHHPKPLRQCVAECPAELETVLLRILQKSPAERYQSMEDVLLDLDPVSNKLQAQFVADLIQQSGNMLEQGEFAQARDLLRQALQVESGNHQARALLERANTELKRLLNRPKAQQYIEKGRALLEEGKVQEAKNAAESALELDSTFAPAQELRRVVGEELDRARIRAECLEAAKQRLAEGLPEEAEVLLAKVLQTEPGNKQALALQQQVSAEQAERQKRARIQEGLRQARELWTQQDYGTCIELLVDLQKEFPGEEEVSRQLEIAREDQIEQQKQQGLLESRNLLAIGRHEDCLALLTGLQKQFPQDEEIPRLLEEVRKDQLNRRRLHGLAQARSVLAAGQYEACISLLTSLRWEFPADQEIPKLLEAAAQNQAEQHRQRCVAELRKHLAARRYEECVSLLATLEKEFPQDDEILRLKDAVREEQAEQRRQRRVADVRKHLAARHYEECVSLLATLEKEFPQDDEILRLKDAVRQEQAEQRKHQRLEEVRNLLASKDYDKSLALLASLRKEFPGEDEVHKLLESARVEQAEQRKQEGLAEARRLLAARRYDQSLNILSKLQADFPTETEIRRLLQSTREEQAEQRKQESLAEARRLLAARRYDESINLLEKLQGDFPAEIEIRNQLATAREDLAEQNKQQKLNEARSRLAAQSFGEALTVVESLVQDYPKDAAVLKLRTLVEREREKHARAERIQRELDELKKLMAEKQYLEVVSRTKTLLTEFPAESNFIRLAKFAASQQAEIEREQLLQKTLEEVKALFGANRFEEAARTAQNGLRNFPGNVDLLTLSQQAEIQQRKLEVRQQIEMRIREIRVKINREKFSEAIDLAQQTLVTMGPDTDLTQLLNSAQVEAEVREKKRQQERTFETIRSLMDSGKFDDATVAVEEALKTNVVEAFDPRIQRLSESIKDAKSAAEQKTAPIPAQATPHSVSPEYAFLQAAPLPSAPAPAEKASPQLTSVEKASANEMTLAPQPRTPVEPLPSAPPSPQVMPAAKEAAKEMALSSPTVMPVEPLPSAPLPVEKTSPQCTAAKASANAMVVSSEPVAPAASVGASGVVPPPPATIVQPSPPGVGGKAGKSSLSPDMLARRMEAPVVPRPSPGMLDTGVEQPQPKGRPIWRAPTVAMVLALGLIGAIWASVHSMRSKSPQVSPPSAKTSPGPPAPRIDPQEVQQREALDGANKLIAANDLDGALRQLQQAEALKGPLTSEIDKKISGIEESMKDANLRALRQREEVLWQQALSRLASGRFTDAQKELQQILALPVGGVRREEAQNYLEKVIPQRMLQNDLLDKFRQSMKEGDYASARRAAIQLKQNGGDAAPLAEVDQAEQRRLVQLESQFNQLKQHDDDAAVQQLKALQPKLQALASESGPQSAEALNYANNIPAAIGDVQARAQKRIADAGFQQIVQRYQLAANGNDKNALAAARTEFQSVIQSGGPHTEEAQRYLSDVNSKLAALNQPVVVPEPKATVKPEKPSVATVDNDAAVRAVIQKYVQAFDQRNADAVRQVWPSIGPLYAKLKRAFDGASSIQEQMDIESVDFNADGTQAVVKGQMSQDYTPKGDKTKRVKNAAIFHLAKLNSGAWVITNVQ